MFRLKGDWSVAEASTINVTHKTKLQNTSFSTVTLNGLYYYNTHQPNFDSWYVTHSEHLHAHIFLQVIPTQPPSNNMIHGLYHRVDGQLWLWLRSIRDIHTTRPWSITTTNENIQWFWDVTPCRVVNRYQALLLDCSVEAGSKLRQSLVQIYRPACHPSRTWKVHQHDCENFKPRTARLLYPYQINHSVVINFTEHEATHEATRTVKYRWPIDHATHLELEFYVQVCLLLDGYGPKLN